MLKGGFIKLINMNKKDLIYVMIVVALLVYFIAPKITGNVVNAITNVSSTTQKVYNTSEVYNKSEVNAIINNLNVPYKI
jgi:hypothetical protein